MSGLSWDPSRYQSFSDERGRPGFDLLARVGVAPNTVWDLGCGTGDLTAALATRWPSAQVWGLDSSEEMLEEARRHSTVTWIHGDIAEWQPDTPVDFVFSNAALHWLDDHQDLFPRLMATVAPGGAFAVQMPRNFGEPSHVLLAETARSADWVGRVGHVVKEAPVGSASFYHDALGPMSSSVDIWETEYSHLLTGKDPVARWVRGTALLPYIEALGEAADDFIADYARRLRVAYPERSDGTTVFGFRRLFIVAQP